MPEESSQHTDSLAVVDLVLIGSLLLSLVGGLLAAFASALVGGLAAQAGGQWGEFGISLGGAVGTAFAGVCLPLALARSLRPWHRTGAWCLAGLLFALMLDRYIPPRFDWSMYRWALGGTPFGILLGSYCEPIRLVRGGKIEATGKGQIFVDIAVILASVVKLLYGRHVGSVLAGMVGGTLGGFWVSTIVAGVGGKEAGEWLGSYLVIPMCGALLGALGGSCGGWAAWRIATVGAESGTASESKPPSDSNA